MSVQISYKKQAVLGIFLLLCLITAVEIGARAYEYFLQPCNLENADTLSEYDYLLKRQICYDQQNLIYSSKPVFSISPNQHFETININSNGFRGAEIKDFKSNDDFRIIVIGGSTVFGTGMSSDLETFPFELQKIINDDFNNIEVINAGVSSLTSVEEVWHIKEKIFDLTPDMIIVYDGWNNVHMKKISEPELDYSEDDSLKLKDFQKHFRTPVVVYRYIIVPIMNLDVENDYSRNFSSAYNSEMTDSIASLWQKNMNEFCDLADKKNIKSVVILQPSLLHGKKPLSTFEKSVFIENDHYVETFKELSERSKILRNCHMVTDFSDIFNDSTEGVFFDEIHLNNLGNKIVAENMLKLIYFDIPEKFRK